MNKYKENKKWELIVELAKHRDICKNILLLEQNKGDHRQVSPGMHARYIWPWMVDGDSLGNTVMMSLY